MERRREKMRWLIELIKRLFGAVVCLANSAARKLFKGVKKMFETTKKLFWKIIGFVKSNMRRAITTTIVLGLLTTALTLFYFFNPWLILVYFLIPAIWFVLSIKIVWPDEMAVKVYFGNTVAVCDSGFRFVPFTFGLTYLERYPKKMYNFAYKKIEVITRAGKYPPENGEQYGALKIQVDAAAYLNFPREITDIDVRDTETKKTTHPLIKILRAGVPINDVKLQDWTEEAVLGALRLAFGKITWRQAVEDMKAVNDEVARVFIDVDGALIKAGFRTPGIKLVVAQIHIPKEVENALTGPEITRLKAEAAGKDAEAQAIDRVETILYAMARTKGVDVKTIQEEIKNNTGMQEKFLEYAKDLHADLEKADRGAYFKFDSPGRGGIDKTLLDLVALLSRGVPGAGGTGGGGTSGSQGEQQKEKKKKKLEDMTYEEKRQAMDDARKRLEKEKGGG